MSEITDFVLSEPLFDTHEHQLGFTQVEKAKASLDYRAFTEWYADADMVTANGVTPSDLSTPEAFFKVWDYVKTTGYGQAADAACRAMLGMAFTRENAEAITAGLRQFVSTRSAANIYADLYAKANVKWAICDECWDGPSKLELFTGREHPSFFRHALRCDQVIAPSSKEQIQQFEQRMNCSIHRLADLDRALDAHAAAARKAGTMTAFKCGLAYVGTLQFDDIPYPAAEAVFEAIMQNRSPADTKPLTAYLFHRLVQRAEAFDLPLQIHTGYLAGNWGSPTQGDPAPLIPVFQRYRKVRFDLFHAGWPHCELMGAIGKAFPNIYLDLCWAWSLNPVAMERVLSEWLSAVPDNKIFAFGADAATPYAVPGYAAQARQGIAAVLEAKLARGEYDLSAARHVAKRIMHGNAREVYRFE